MRGDHSAIMRGLSVALVTSMMLAGCSRTYIFSPERMPSISEGQLHLREFERSHAPVNSFYIKRIGLRHHSEPYVLRAPSEEEYTALLERKPLDAQLIEIDVDASQTHWRDYGLGGAGISVTLALIGSLDQDNALFQTDPGNMLFRTGLIGFVGFMTGLVIGSLAAPNTVDMRYVGAEAP